MKYNTLKAITISAPRTVIDHNWLNILTDDRTNERSAKILKELRALTGERSNRKLFDKYEGYTVEELLEDAGESTEIFARKCDITGKGMNSGYCFGDGEKYAKTKADALKIARQYGYKSLKKAYDDEIYYFTEWDAEDEAKMNREFYTEKGELIKL